MALFRCQDCGKEISDQAPACIHCGRPKGASPPAAGPPAKKPLPGHALLNVAGGAAMAVGLLCLLAGKTQYAMVALPAGLVLALAGGVWSWMANK